MDEKYGFPGLSLEILIYVCGGVQKIVIKQI